MSKRGAIVKQESGKLVGIYPAIIKKTSRKNKGEKKRNFFIL